MKKSLAAEFTGTFVLVLFGTGAIIVNDLFNGIVTHTGVSAAFGIAVAGTILVFGNVSGAHINPAVTIGFWCSGKLPRDVVIPYIISQCLGAVSASLLLHFLFPQHKTLGATLPSGPVWESFSIELFMTFLLMFLIIIVAGVSWGKTWVVAVSVGMLIFLEAFFGGPVSGASMNPARSIGPAVISGQFQYLWLYLSAPVAGAIVSVAFCRFTRGKECCPGSETCSFQ